MTRLPSCAVFLHAPSSLVNIHQKVSDLLPAVNHPPPSFITPPISFTHPLCLRSTGHCTPIRNAQATGGRPTLTTPATSPITSSSSVVSECSPSAAATSRNQSPCGHAVPPCPPINLFLPVIGRDQGGHGVPYAAARRTITMLPLVSAWVSVNQHYTRWATPPPTAQPAAASAHARSVSEIALAL